MIGCFPLIFDAELSQLCSYCRKSAPEDADDLVANLGCRESGSVYDAEPIIDFHLGSRRSLIGIAVHRDGPSVSSICRIRSSVVMA
jgi:hypothetical protein